MLTICTYGVGYWSSSVNNANGCNPAIMASTTAWTLNNSITYVFRKLVTCHGTDTSDSWVWGTEEKGAISDYFRRWSQDKTGSNTFVWIGKRFSVYENAPKPRRICRNTRKSSSQDWVDCEDFRQRFTYRQRQHHDSVKHVPYRILKIEEEIDRLLQLEVL